MASTSQPLTAGELVREARRRAGLTQELLARRCGTTQSAIARIEGGSSEPSLARVRRLIAATGSTLQCGLSSQEPDPDWAAILRNRSLDLDARWDKAVTTGQFVLDGRAAQRAASADR